MRIVRYFFVGGTAAATDLALFALLTLSLGWHWFPAALVSFVVATFVNYFLSIRHVFESGVRFKKHHEIALVFAVSGVGLAINQSFLWLLIEAAGLNQIVAKIGATGLVFVWNYGARRNFVFKHGA